MIKKLVHENLVGITISQSIHRFGQGMVFVFIPLLILSKGHELWHVAAFYVVYALCKLIVNYPSARAINVRGARVGLIVGYIATSLLLVCASIYSATGSLWLLGFMSLAMAVQNSFLWNSQHLHISRVMDAARKSRDMANIESIIRLATAVAPLIGGFVARKGGINYIMSMEMANDIATITLWSVLGVAAYLASQDVFFGIAFFGAAVLAWLCLLMRPEAPAMEKAS